MTELKCECNTSRMFQRKWEYCRIEYEKLEKNFSMISRLLGTRATDEISENQKLQAQLAESQLENAKLRSALEKIDTKADAHLQELQAKLEASQLENAQLSKTTIMLIETMGRMVGVPSKNE